MGNELAEQKRQECRDLVYKYNKTANATKKKEYYKKIMDLEAEIYELETGKKLPDDTIVSDKVKEGENGSKQEETDGSSD